MSVINQQNQKIEIYGQYGAALTLVEITLGSLLHTFHVPFAGQFLSLNQGYLLCRLSLASRELDDHFWMPYGVSNVAAILKSLSPAGKKLGPMLSLSMQGFLFNLGVGLFGVNHLGLIMGMSLLSVWTFVQTFLTAYLFFGSTLFEALFILANKTLSFVGLNSEVIIWLLAAAILSKIILACLLAIFSIHSQKINSWQDQYILNNEEQIKKIFQNRFHDSKIVQNKKNIHRLVLQDLLSPFFLISFSLTLIFAFLSESKASEWVWILLRPIAIGCIFFYVSRSLTLERYLQKMTEGRFHLFAKSCLKIIKKIKKNKKIVHIKNCQNCQKSFSLNGKKKS